MPGSLRDNQTLITLGIVSCVCTLLYALPWRKRLMLQDKVVLVTGASGGLGEALAEMFFYAGCKVIISGRQKKSLEAVKNRLSKKMQANRHVPAILVMDISAKNDVPEKIKKALNIFGHIDILINNAGIGSRGWVHETELEVFEKVMQVNFHGQVYVTKDGASKHALEGFFDSLRAELSFYNIDLTTARVSNISTNFSLNAIGADGSGYNKMDKSTKTGLDPKYVAREILKNVARRKQEVLIAPFYSTIAIWLRAVAPWVLFKAMAILARREAAQDKKEPIHYAKL